MGTANQWLEWTARVACDSLLRYASSAADQEQQGREQQGQALHSSNANPR